jgi:prepilin-type N-terminal cleavage/methylation domain-containing protein
MSRSRARRRRGFTLIEAMVALSVLAFASAGSLSALLVASQVIREGQLRQSKTVLVDAKEQRMLLADKKVLKTGAVAAPVADPATLAVGASPWAIDDSVPEAGDLGTGAFFDLLPDGSITPRTSLTIVTAPSCASANIPTGTYCREVLIAKGLPPDKAASTVNAAVATALTAAGAQAYTRWVRVWRKGEPEVRAVVSREVFVE